MDNISAKVVAHSKSPRGVELLTLEVNIPRVILAENNTHRALSRGYQSSRACPVAKQIDQVLNNPYLPPVYGKNKPGMQAEGILSPEEQKEAEQIILDMRDYCLEGVKKLSDKDGLNGHKQWVTRYIEPWLYTKGIITATREAWDAYLVLRYHKDADPAIYQVARCVRQAITYSSPVQMNYGDWHLPYVRVEKDFSGKPYYTTSMEEVVKAVDVLSLEGAIKTSVSCCAQVSYRNLDGSIEKANKIYDMLNMPVDGIWKENPPHFSCAEHQAMCYDGVWESGFKDRSDIGGNFQTYEWYQYRKMLEQGREKEMMELLCT